MKKNKRLRLIQELSKLAKIAILLISNSKTFLISILTQIS